MYNKIALEIKKINKWNKKIKKINTNIKYYQVRSVSKVGMPVHPNESRAVMKIYLKPQSNYNIIVNRENFLYSFELFHPYIKKKKKIDT